MKREKRRMRLLGLLLCLTVVLGLLPGELPGAKAEIWVNTPDELKNALNDPDPLAPTIKLSTSINISQWTPVVTKEGTVLDLAGHTITISSDDGIAVGTDNEKNTIGSLTITDSSSDQTGKIVADNNGSHTGITVYPKATVTLEKGTITGFGTGVVLLDKDATFNMTGGTIADCHCGVDQGTGTINISGSPIIKKKEEKNAIGIFIPIGKVINITGALTDKANIGVTLGNTTGIFTKDFGIYNPGAEPSTFFKSDNDSGKIFLNNGEGKINAAYVISVSFDDKKGSVTGNRTLEKGTTANLTAVPAGGYVFDNWTENESSVSTANPYTLHSQQQPEPDGELYQEELHCYGKQ